MLTAGTPSYGTRCARRRSLTRLHRLSSALSHHRAAIGRRMIFSAVTVATAPGGSGGGQPLEAAAWPGGGQPRPAPYSWRFGATFRIAWFCLLPVRNASSITNGHASIRKRIANPITPRLVRGSFSVGRLATSVGAVLGAVPGRLAASRSRTRPLIGLTVLHAEGAKGGERGGGPLDDPCPGADRARSSQRGSSAPRASGCGWARSARWYDDDLKPASSADELNPETPARRPDQRGPQPRRRSRPTAAVRSP